MENSGRKFASARALAMVDMSRERLPEKKAKKNFALYDNRML